MWILSAAFGYDLGLFTQVVNCLFALGACSVFLRKYLLGHLSVHGYLPLSQFLWLHIRKLTFETSGRARSHMLALGTAVLSVQSFLRFISSKINLVVFGLRFVQIFSPFSGVSADGVSLKRIVCVSLCQAHLKEVWNRIIRKVKYKTRCFFWNSAFFSPCSAFVKQLMTFNCFEWEAEIVLHHAFRRLTPFCLLKKLTL